MKITMKNEKIIKVLVADNSEFAKNNLRDFLESSEGIQLILSLIHISEPTRRS